MAWEYYGDALIIVGVMTTILLIVGLNFLKSRFRRRLIFSLTLLVMGYVVFLIGLVLVRGWDEMGWSLTGFSLYVIGFIIYIFVVTYRWFKARRKTHS